MRMKSKNQHKILSVSLPLQASKQEASETKTEENGMERRGKSKGKSLPSKSRTRLSSLYESRAARPEPRCSRDVGEPEPSRPCWSRCLV
jgi:hypothetical protein